MRVYGGCDVVGTEISSAFKNILALAAGASDGMGFGDNTKALLLTRGNRGMLLVEEGVDPVSIPIVGSEDIVDVSGAGDTVCAVLALGLASRATLLESAHLANHAASVVVMKPGTATLAINELDEALAL